MAASVVQWNGSARTTSSVSATQLTAAIGPTDIATVGTVPVTVFNPTPGGGTSNAQTFTISSAPSNLVAAYGFEEGSGTSTADASGNGNLGTIANVTWSSAGRFGNALSFNGTNAWVTVNDANSLDLTNGMTLQSWVNPTALSGGSNAGWRTVILKQQTSDLVYGLYANTDQNRPSGYIYIGGELDTVGTTQLPLNSWTHLATTYDGSTLRLFVNGVQVSSRAVTGNIAQSTNPLRIGGNALWGEYFSGLIDEVRVYSRALSQTEIQNDRDAPVGGSSGNPTPTITTISPNSGTTAGGQSLTITGTNLLGTSAVTFGGTAATINGTPTSTQVMVTTPAHAAGAVNVVVTAPTGSATATNGYTYVAGPTITTISPNSGTTAGGQSVTITGTNLLGTSAVTFGGTAATINGTPTSTQVSVTTPAHAAGAVNVVVTAPGGSTTATNGYTYVAGPTITTISPNSGTTAGGQSVTITGTNLLGTTAVTFGGTAATINGTPTSTQVVVTTPAHAAGAVNVVVTAPGGSTTATNGYTYVAGPTITTISRPNSGTTAGGQSVTITGTNLLGTSAVTFGGTAATINGTPTSTQVMVTTPAHAAGAVNVVVTAPGGSTTATNGYTYLISTGSPPVISSFTPTSGTVGTLVTLTGSGFTGTTSVIFNATSAPSFTVGSDTQITATVPAGATSGKISVTNAAGTGQSSTDFKINLLLNASFEIDANADSRPDSWTSSNRFTRSNAVPAVNDSYVGRHFATNNANYNITQTISNLTAGTMYNFTGSVNIPATSDSFSFTLDVRWRNASNNVISTTTIKSYTASTNGGWDQALANLIAPAGTTNALVRMVVTSLNATIYVDDFLFGP